MSEVGEIVMDRTLGAVAGSDSSWVQDGLYAPLPEYITVLLVEDDEADAFLIRKALQSNPRVHNVVRARDGVEAMELLEGGGVTPDLAIIDLRMPRKDGFTLLREIDQRDDADFPSIVLTSSRGGADSYRSRKRGARMFLSKPHTADRLAAVLSSAITELS